MKTKLLLLFFILILSSCSLFKNLIDIKKPKVTSENLHIVAISFDEVQLSFDVVIENPNAISTKFSKMDYNLLIDNKSFVSGVEGKSFEITANGKSTVKIPVTLVYKNIFNTISNVINQDKLDYDINCNLFLNLPILNDIQIPLNVKGSVPIPKLPKIQFVSFKKTSMNLLGVDLELILKVENLNNFKMKLPDFTYDFKINGNKILNGNSIVSINSKSNTEIPFKIHLGFLQIGESIISLLKDGGDVNYDLKTSMTIESDNPLIKSKTHAFDLNGKVKL